MNRYVAFLRGMNLGKRRLPMSRLKALFEELKFARVETFIASGNVLFSTRSSDVGRLEARIAGHLEQALGYAVDTFVRTTAEVAAIEKGRVFPEDGQDGFTVHVAILHQPLSAATARQLEGITTDRDAFRVVGREFYWLCRGRTSESEVWSLPEARALRLPTLTMRNLTSIRKLVAKHIASPG